jgi:hypothetical protein
MSIKTEIRYRAIHYRVLIVYVANIPLEPIEGAWSGDWKAYVTPVTGKNHEQEADLWKSIGTQLTEREARAMWPRMAASYDDAGLKWRR